MTNKSPQELKTVLNFRDLGGLTTSSGHVVRSGLVFRSGDLSRLSNEDAAELASAGLRTVVDLRDPVAWERHPDRLEGLPVRLLQVDMTTRPQLELRARWNAGGISESEASRYIRAINASLARDRTRELGTLFQHLTDTSAYPLLMHCNIGKDRTGFVVALLLHALGVPEASIYADYLLSHEALASFREEGIRRPGFEHVGPLWEARREYLDEGLSVIRASYGSIDAYLERVIGVTGEMRAKLKDALLAEP